MEKFLTKYKVFHGLDENCNEIKIPIYLIIKNKPMDIFESVDYDNYDLQCETEIPAVVWYEIFEGSIEQYLLHLKSDFK